MAVDLKLPVAQVRPVRIRALQESALCLSYDNRGIHILVDRFEDSARAIFLNGENAFHSFRVEAIHDWKGLALTNYEIVVDLGSAFDSENEWPPLGAISVGPDGVFLQVAITDHHGFTDKEGLKLDVEGSTIAPGLRASFTRWAFQIGEKDSPQFFWLNARKTD